MFTPEQLMIFRGYLTATMALIALRGVIGRVDRYTYCIMFTLPFVTLGLFEGIRRWGAGPTIIILTTTPLVNLFISVVLGRKISTSSIIGFVLIIGGVIMARWGGEFQFEGFAWSVFATLANGILYEFFARAKANSMQKCFYACVGMGTLGLLMSIGSTWTAVAGPKIIVTLLGFAFVGGFVYWIANLLAFQNLPTTEASILAQGETPAVILGANILLGEQLSYIQWVGVIIALYGAWYLSRWLSKK